MTLLRAYDEAEPHLLDAVRKVILGATLVVASPFLMLAFLFFLLEKPMLWLAIPGTIAVLVLAGGLVGWLVVRSKVRGLRRALTTADGIVDVAVLDRR